MYIPISQPSIKLALYSMSVDGVSSILAFLPTYLEMGMEVGKGQRITISMTVYHRLNKSSSGSLQIISLKLKFELSLFGATVPFTYKW